MALYKLFSFVRISNKAADEFFMTSNGTWKSIILKKSSSNYDDSSLRYEGFWPVRLGL
jgi:hypothetical protein